MTLYNNRKHQKSLLSLVFSWKTKSEKQNAVNTPRVLFSEVFCRWQQRWMIITKIEKKFSFTRKKNICGRQELDRTREKNLKHLFHAVYWFLLNCQRSIFLTVPIIFRTRFYQAVSNALDGTRKTPLTGFTRTSHFSPVSSVTRQAVQTTGDLERLKINSDWKLFLIKWLRDFSLNSRRANENQ